MDAPNSEHIPYNGQYFMHQLKVLSFKPEYSRTSLKEPSEERTPKFPICTENNTSTIY